MPKRSRSMSKKRAAVSKRFKSARRNYTGRPKRRTISLNTHKFSRYGLAETITVSNTEDSSGFSFSFNNMINSSEFAALFDRYRIDKVIVKLQLVTNPNAIWAENSTTGGTSSNWYPKVWSINDYDDSSAETIAQLKERVGVKCRVLEPNKTLTYVINPAVSVQMYKTLTSTGYGPKWGQWIDMQDVGVPHYGIKFAFDCLGIDPAGSFKIVKEVKYFFTCKDVR